MKPKTVKLDLNNGNYQRLLKCGEEAEVMHSGFVTLQPGETVGKHSTENREEVLIVFEGQGKFILNDENELKLEYGYIAYCPPHTEHNVLNTGDAPLKYVFVVSRVEKQ